MDGVGAALLFLLLLTVFVLLIVGFAACWSQSCPPAQPLPPA
jgi:hypothetical protein